MPACKHGRFMLQMLVSNSDIMIHHFIHSSCPCQWKTLFSSNIYSQTNSVKYHRKSFRLIQFVKIAFTVTHLQWKYMEQDIPDNALAETTAIFSFKRFSQKDRCYLSCTAIETTLYLWDNSFRWMNTNKRWIFFM